MLDHIFLTVSDVARSVAFYEAVLPQVGIDVRHDYADEAGGQPDLKGFGANSRMFFWLRQGVPHAAAVHVGFIAHNRAEVEAAYIKAINHGATDNPTAGGAPGARLHFDPNYYAANILDPDGYSLEFVYKNWQHKP